nr:hypothetical protein [Tanacetum cinerariifolium]
MYVYVSDPEKDEKDPKEDPADYPADRGNNDDDESSNDDDDDDNVKKDEEDKEEEEHLALAEPFDEAMTTTNQGMSLAKVKQIIAQRVANAIETIAIYETKTRMACESTNQTKLQEGKIVEDTKNKRKWEDDHKGSSSQQ